MEPSILQRRPIETRVAVYRPLNRLHGMDATGCGPGHIEVEAGQNQPSGVGNTPIETDRGSRSGALSFSHIAEDPDV